MIATWFLYFVIYSFLGWFCETVYCSVFQKRVVNRGFLNGPFCPIYGFGALIVILFLSPFTDYAAVVFLLGMLSTSVLEYVTSWGMEKLFHSKWWDYSKKLCNIKGRVCLQNSLLFGVMAVVVMFFVHPFVAGLVLKMPWMAQQLTALGFLFYFVCDYVVTVRAVLHLNARLKKLDQSVRELKEKMDHWKLEKREELKGTETVQMLEEKIRAMRSDNKLLQRRLLHAFPNLQPKNYGEQLKAVRESIKKRKKDKSK